MTTSSTEPIVSHYGFLNTEDVPGKAYYVNLYVPVTILAQLQLAAGSSALVQGLSHKSTGKLTSEPTEIHLRARTGLENRNYPNPFTATIRFPNQPQTLSSFLIEARQANIPLLSIRTFGELGDAWADVVVEGSMPAGAFASAAAVSFVERHPLRQMLDAVLERMKEEPKGTVTTAENLRFSNELPGYVMPSRYFIEDLPVLSGDYLKVQVDTDSTPAGKPFKDARGKLRLVRLGLDLSSMTLKVDCLFSRLSHYLLRFRGRNLQQAPPVTKAILDAIPDGMNVDSISAYEYVEFDPANPASSPAAGRIEVLCTVDEEQDRAGAGQPGDPKVKERLRTAVQDVVAAPGRIEEMSLETLAFWLSQLEQRHADAVKDRIDLEHGVFRKLLNNGRYAYMGPLGEGSQGSVHKYYDLHACRTVAGKRILLEQIPSAELKGLLFKRGQETNAHLAPLLDYFFDDTVPVLVMPYLKHTLSDHIENPMRIDGADPHRYPEDIGQFIEMGIQLCDGLEFLHRKDFDGVRLIHCDIKPQNIGVDSDHRQLSWKILDFGLARRQRAELQFEYTTTVRGTYDYMSPQVVVGKRTLQNDIYALGIVFFQVLNKWRHPGRPLRDTKFNRQMGWNPMLPQEVDDYQRYLKSGGNEPASFSLGTWAPSSEFARDLSQDASDELRGIVFDMIEFSETRRRASAAEVGLKLEGWRKSHL